MTPRTASPEMQAKIAVATAPAAPDTRKVTREAAGTASFEQLVAKVHQAELALEEQERRVAADWRRLKTSWRMAWTPGRIVVAGLATGFAVGSLDPARMLAKGGGFMRLITMVSTLMAGTGAQAAASKAEDAADSATDAAQAVAPGAATAAAAQANALDETERALATERAARLADAETYVE